MKATGDGLRIPMRTLTVSGPSDPPRLLDWAGHDRPPRVTLRTLRGPDGNGLSGNGLGGSALGGSGLDGAAAALAVLGAPPRRLIEIDAEPALAALGRTPGSLSGP